MLYKGITCAYAPERNKKVHLIISAHTHSHMHFICVYTKNTVCVCGGFLECVSDCYASLVVLAAEISGLLDQDIDMEIPTNTNGKDFPAVPLNSVLTHPR